MEPFVLRGDVICPKMDRLADDLLKRNIFVHRQNIRGCIIIDGILTICTSSSCTVSSVNFDDDEPDEKRSVVKTIPMLNPGQTIDRLSRNIERAKDEILAMAEMNCSNHSVRLLCVFVNRSDLHIVMELMERGSLSDLIKRVPRLSMEAIQYIIKKLVCGLHEMHTLDHPIVHQDIKPPNILLDKDGNVKIADYGLCKRGAGQFTSDCGTVQFIAPEVANKSDRCDHKLDVWSLGVTIVVMLGGREQLPHFEIAKKNEVIWRIRDYSQDDMSLVLSELRRTGASDACVDFLRMCLVVDPTMRASSSDLMRHDFILGQTDARCLDEYFPN